MSRIAMTADCGCRPTCTFMWAPVEALLRVSVQPRMTAGGIYKHCTVDDIAEALTLDRATIQGYRRRGYLSATQADRVACKLGLHPLLLWPDYYDIEGAA